MNKMYGMTGIRIKFFEIYSEISCRLLNDFLEEYDGNIIDIQYQQNNYNAKQIMIIYKAIEN